MGDKPKQARVFRVKNVGEGGLPAEDLFDRLHNAEHPAKRKNRRPLKLKHVFHQTGHDTFLLDLDKATPDFVEKVVKHALGPHCSVECVTRYTQHESFVPAVEGKAKETKLSTVEREAAAMAGVDCSAGFILVAEKVKVAYSYNDKGRLEEGITESRGAHVHAVPTSDTAQVDMAGSVSPADLTAAVEAIGFTASCIASTTTEKPTLGQDGAHPVWAIAVALGLVDRGCAMAWGDPCSCGDECRCVNCPQHGKHMKEDAFPSGWNGIKAADSSSSTKALPPLKRPQQPQQLRQQDAGAISDAQQAKSHQQGQRFGRRGCAQAFAQSLFQILETTDPNVVGWSSSGKTFRVRDRDKFCKEIMPKFSKQNKYETFQRQLNLYGFRKMVRGIEAGGYMHPSFERGRPDKLSQVRREFRPEVPPEFAHAVHGCGVNDRCSDVHSKDGFDDLGPRKIRRTGLSFDQHDNQNGQRSSSTQGFLAVSRPPDGNSDAESGGILGQGGLGLTTDAMSRMEQVKSSKRALAMMSGIQASGSGVGPQAVLALGEDLSTCLLDHLWLPPNDTKPLRDSGAPGGVAGTGQNRREPTNGAGMAADKRPAAARLRTRSCVDEVTETPSGPAAGGSFEDEVKGHLEFDVEDEGGPLQQELFQETGSDEMRAPTNDDTPRRGRCRILSWGGLSTTTFEENPEELVGHLRLIPNNWRSPLSLSTTTMIPTESTKPMPPGGGLDEHGAPTVGEGSRDERKLKKQGSLEMLSSIMCETLESMGIFPGGGSGSGQEEEAKAAAEAALAMGSMWRAKCNEQVSGGGGGGTGGSP